MKNRAANLPDFLWLLKVQKIGRPGNAAVAAADWKDYQLGSAGNIGSLPEGYAVLGWLLQPIRLGQPVRLLRVERNRVEAFFTASWVTRLTASGFETENSVYQFDWITVPASERNKWAQAISTLSAI